MTTPPAPPIDSRDLFVATMPARRLMRRRATAAVLLTAGLLLLLVPWAKTPLPAVAAFIPLYQSALIVCDLITAYLLFGQFRILGRSALGWLAAGYLFSALMAGVHALSFPGLFSPTGLLGGCTCSGTSASRSACWPTPVARRMGRPTSHRPARGCPPPPAARSARWRYWPWSLRWPGWRLPAKTGCRPS
jgi:hypothetical protein